MHGLKIPSSRSLIIFTGEEPVFRETTEPGAMIVRTASTHIRFGNFEYLCHNGKQGLLPELIDHVIEEYFPEYVELENKNELFFEAVVKKNGRANCCLAKRRLCSWRNEYRQYVYFRRDF